MASLPSQVLYWGCCCRFFLDLSANVSGLTKIPAPIVSTTTRLGVDPVGCRAPLVPLSIQSRPSAPPFRISLLEWLRWRRTGRGRNARPAWRPRAFIRPPRVAGKVEHAQEWGTGEE